MTNGTKKTKKTTRRIMRQKTWLISLTGVISVFLQTTSVTRNSDSVLVTPGLCPVITEVFFPHVISCLSTHHEVLDHHTSRCSGPFLSAICFCLQHCDMVCAERGAAFKFAHFLTFALFFDFVLCHVGYFVLTQSHSVDVSCWSALMIPSLSRIFFLCNLCVVFLKWNPFSTVFCYFDP